MKVLSNGVQKALAEVVGLAMMFYTMWVENLEHYHRRYVAKRDQEEEEIK